MHILHLEDSSPDAELIENLVRTRWKECTITRVRTGVDFEDAVLGCHFDLILSDYTLPGYNGLAALAYARIHCPEKPFIYLSGTIGEERAIDAVKAGATDYIIKDRPGRLIPAIKAALEHVEQEDAGRRAQEKIEEQASLLDKAREAICVVDIERRITFWNAAAERLYHWSARDAIGRDLRELIYPGDVTGFDTAYTIALAAGEWRGELHATPYDDELAVVESFWSLVTDKSGVAKSILIIDADVTEQRQKEAQFLRSQRMDSIGALASGVAHDLNNALGPILMITEVLQMKCTDPETNRFLNLIRACAQRGAGMVKQVLTFARGTDGERGVVQIRHLIKEMVSIAQQTFPKATQISECVENVWTIFGNPTELHQILLNLCVNARDAMPNGGTLTLAANNVNCDETYCRMAPDAKPGRYVVIKVTDTGTGMTPEVTARIFDPFFTTKSSSSGTGLGLSTVRSIVKSHDGFLTLRTEVGKGSEFKVHLPATPETATQAAEATRPALPMGNGELILVADSEAAISSVAAQSLQMFGYEVLTANDGIEAVTFSAQNVARLRLMITGMDMAIMDGPTAVRAIRKMIPQLKIIAATGSDSQQASAASLDVQAFIRKPYTADELLRMVHSVLRGDSADAPKLAGSRQPTMASPSSDQ